MCRCSWSQWSWSGCWETSKPHRSCVQKPWNIMKISPNYGWWEVRSRNSRRISTKRERPTTRVYVLSSPEIAYLLFRVDVLTSNWFLKTFRSLCLFSWRSAHIPCPYGYFCPDWRRKLGSSRELEPSSRKHGWRIHNPPNCGKNLSEKTKMLIFAWKFGCDSLISF